MCTIIFLLRIISQLNIVDSVDIGDYANGVAFCNKSVYATENGADRIYKIDLENMNVISYFTYQGGLDGLGSDGEYLWLGYYPSSIRKIDTLGNLIGSWTSPGAYSYGMAFDSVYLWHSDKNLQAIFKLDYNDPTRVIQSFYVTWTPRDLEWYNGHLWAISETDSIYELDPRNMSIVNSWATGRLSSAGIAIGEGYLLFSTTNRTGWVYKVEGIINIEETRKAKNVTFLNLYPNPFHGSISLLLNVPQNQEVTVKIYNLSGRLVRQIFKGKTNTATLGLTWNGRNDVGTPVAPGIYLVRIENENTGIFEKIVFLGK